MSDNSSVNPIQPRLFWGCSGLGEGEGGGGGAVK